MAMNDFEKLVKKHYKKRSDLDINNSFIKHAQTLVKYLFKIAKEEKKDIKIMTGCLFADFYNSFAQDAKEILDSGNKISVISLNKCEEGEFLSNVEQSDNGKISIAKHMKSIPHFILVGDSAYRLEIEDKKTAVGVFNNSYVGSFLNKLFDVTAKESTEAKKVAVA